MRVLVLTVVHVPLDARITARQAAALVAAGHHVTLAAPWTSETPVPDGISAVPLPRAAGRKRLSALRAARASLRRLAPDHDLVLVHDPELLLVLAGLDLPPVVWDVHEDTGAALADKSWLPLLLRRPARASVTILERLAEQRLHLLLAEDSYRQRFCHAHPVVANDTIVPDNVAPPGDDRVLYVGRISRGRGAETLLRLADLLRPDGVRVEIVGPADDDVARRLHYLRNRGAISWSGPLPNAEALARIDGALAGLSLLRDEPNYRGSRPTKVIEYMAHGVPVVTTPNPLAAEIVTSAGCGEIVPFDDPYAAAAAVRRLRDDPERRRALGAAGHAATRAHYDWTLTGPAFVRQLEAWAATER